MGFVSWIIALFATAIGVVLSTFLISLDIINLPELINALVWLLITWFAYLGGKQVDDESGFKIISLNFIITWAFTTIGALLGFIISTLIDTGSISLQLDALLTAFFFFLPLTIGPTLGVSLGLGD
ncbi:MAG: hypothetical protein ACXAE3_14185 [Candidatus Kariarchaeaceae archaeon]|jgi:hypothetical protein